MAIVMKQYLGVREDANGTKQIPVNSNTATFVATQPVGIKEKKTPVQSEKPKWSDTAIDYKKEESDTRSPRDHGIPCSINSYRRKVLIF